MLTNGIGEKIVQKEWRTVEYLQKTVQTIYGIFKDLEDHLFEKISVPWKVFTGRNCFRYFSRIRR